MQALFLLITAAYQYPLASCSPVASVLLGFTGWDASGEESAVLAGGRDQIAFRWLPEAGRERSWRLEVSNGSKFECAKHLSRNAFEQAADVAPVAVPMHMPKEKEAFFSTHPVRIVRAV